MKAKKFLKQQAEAEKKEILEASDMQSFDEFFHDIEKPAQLKRGFFKRYYKWFISAAGIAACAIILTTVLLLYPAKEKIVYDENNFVTSSSTIEEMDNDMTEFNFQIDTTAYSVEVEKTVDSVSGDVILYRLQVDQYTSLINFEFIAVCNPNYFYPYLEITDEYTDAGLTNYSVSYKQEILPNEYGLDLKAKAKIQKGSEFIYITEYNEYMTDEEGSLLKIIQEMFI